MNMMNITRREFLRDTACGVVAMSAVGAAQGGDKTKGHPPMDARKLLSGVIYSRQKVDDWLAGRSRWRGKYDSELGYVVRDTRRADGVDGSTSTYSYGKYGERRMINYADRPCRINTYGDSITEGSQASDGETYQEALAAHLGEPVRNFGVGGWSVYQAYRRMLREEARVPAGMIIFNIYENDHYRQLFAWRKILWPPGQHGVAPPPGPHLRVNLSTGECQECENACPTKESLYSLCDLDWVEERFRDDFMVNIKLAEINARNGHPDHARKALMNIARAHGIKTPIEGNAKAIGATAREICTRAALLGSMKVVEWTEAFARKHGKKVLYVLSFTPAFTASRVNKATRYDQPFVDFLQKNKLPYVDLSEVDASEFAQLSIGMKALDYFKRFRVGGGIHFNPLGNLRQAFAIKGKLVDMLDPKPVAYRAP